VFAPVRVFGFALKIAPRVTTADLFNGLRNDVAGYGFACFAFLMGFIICTTSALYISPYADFHCGQYEKIILRKPQDLNLRYGETAPPKTEAAFRENIATEKEGSESGGGGARVVSAKIVDGANPMQETTAPSAPARPQKSFGAQPASTDV
jgi:hypothetical protein